MKVVLLKSLVVFSVFSPYVKMIDNDSGSKTSPIEVEVDRRV